MRKITWGVLVLCLFFKLPTLCFAEDKTAIFAGGCFWCMEEAFEKIEGVKTVVSGYIDGSKKDPTYKEVSAGTTGHTEAVLITYDSKKVSYDQLLTSFWKNIDPTVKNKQFCDTGSQYRSGIYYQSDSEKSAATKTKNELLKSGKFKDIFTEIKLATKFYPAEEYHQDYYKKNPLRYKFYKASCGRVRRLEKIWGKN